MNTEIKRKKPDYVRVHDSGDYYSPAYLKKWIQIAIHNPHVKFYSYTNMIKLTKEVQLPDNYDIIYSDSGKQKHLINEKTDRHTRIFSSTSDLIDAGYNDSSEYDLRATKWYSPNNHKVGLVFH